MNSDPRLSPIGSMGLRCGSATRKGLTATVLATLATLARFAAFATITTFVTFATLTASGCRQSVPSVCGELDCGCVRQDDCNAGQVCVVGTCRAPGSNAASVYIDLMPPNDSGLLPQAAAGNPRDLAAGLGFNLTLQGPRRLTGTLTGLSAGGRITALRVDNDNDNDNDNDDDEAVDQRLPSARYEPQTEVVAGQPFTLLVMPATYGISFEPTSSSTDPVSRPPLNFTYDLSQDREIHIDYPADDALVVVSGRVVNNGVPVEGAEIRGIAHPDDEPVLRSHAAETAADGSFTLRFPPGATNFELQIEPGSDNTMVPQRSYADLGIGATGAAGAAGASGVELDLALPAQPLTLPILVTDGAGAAVAETVVFLDGAIDGDEATQGRFSAKATTDANGRLQMQLWPGRYDVVVAPPLRSETATRVLEICYARPSTTLECADTPVSDATGELHISLARRVRIAGTVVDSDGAAVPVTHVSFVPHDLERRPTFAATTNGGGVYGLWLDPPPDGADATRYDVVVEPDPGLGLPRHRESVIVSASPEQQAHFVLDASSFAFGLVLTPDGEPLGGVIMAFYTKHFDDTVTGDSASAATTAPDESGELSLIGVGQSGEAGEFVAPLPSVAAP